MTTVSFSVWSVISSIVYSYEILTQNALASIMMASMLGERGEQLGPTIILSWRACMIDGTHPGEDELETPFQ